jgi:hypothetical protein
MSIETPERPKVEFEEPTSLADAFKRRTQLILDIQNIQADLGNDRSDFTGVDYEGWRHRAKRALAYRNAELRFIKAWIIQHSPSGKTRQERSTELVSALQAINGSIGRLLNVYEAAKAVLDNDDDQKLWDILEAAVNQFEQFQPEGGSNGS